MDLTPGFDVPPNCGKRLLPAVLDETAANEPTRIFVSVPKSSDISEGFRDINYGTFAKAVDKFALWLREQVGQESEPKTILYLGPLDIRYLLVLLGAAKAGHIVGQPYEDSLPSSSSNTLGGRVSLVPIATVSRPINRS